MFLHIHNLIGLLPISDDFDLPVVELNDADVGHQQFPYPADDHNVFLFEGICGFVFFVGLQLFKGGVAFKHFGFKDLYAEFEVF